jgi:opacity protein-like surface antigen
MRKTNLLVSLTGLGLLAMAGSAVAADLLPEPPVVIEEPPVVIPEPVIIDDSQGFYLRGDVGISWFDGKGTCIGVEDAFTGDVGAGYRFNRHFRSDVTVTYSGKYKPDCQKIDTWTTMLNGYFDLPITERIAPYVGAGVGWLHVKSTSGYKDDAVGLSAMAGVSFRTSEKTALDVGYRYTYASIKGSPNWKDHAIRVGLRMAMN